MGWPTPGDVRASGIDALLEELDNRIAAASTPEERSGMKGLRDSAKALGKDVTAEVLGAWLARTTGAS